MSANFIDTNIVVYLFSADEPEKRAIAEEAVQGTGTISTQVLNEFANVMIKKFRLESGVVLNACRELTANLNLVTVNEGTIYLAQIGRAHV